MLPHYSDIMRVMASQITGITIVYSTICSGADQRKHQSSTSLAFVRRIHWQQLNSPHAQRASNAENIFIWWRHHVRLAITVSADVVNRYSSKLDLIPSQIARFMGPTWGSPGSCGAPCWPHEPCYQGLANKDQRKFLMIRQYSKLTNKNFEFKHWLCFIN